MTEGWQDKDYLLLFDEQNESAEMAERYGIPGLLPGYILVGLKNWGDFIVKDSCGNLFTCPTVPIAAKHLQPLVAEIKPSTFKADSRFTNKIKWHIQPLVFGGDPSSDKNTAWIDIQQHIEAVKWWNQKYREMKKPS